jgi:predicted transcriptional regulator
MSSTSVYLPPEVLAGLDRLAKREQKSRNRLIVDACRALLEADRGEWPENFFDEGGYSQEELAELREAAREMLDAIEGSRRSKSDSPF